MLDQVSNPPSNGDIPLWWAFVLALIAAVSGEAYRGEQAHIGGVELAKRIIFRSAAAGVLGVCTLWIAMAVGASVMMAGGLAGVISLAGADIALAFYLSAFRKRLGVDGRTE